MVIDQQWLGNTLPYSSETRVFTGIALYPKVGMVGLVETKTRE
jgi:hypothetical protein